MIHLGKNLKPDYLDLHFSNSQTVIFRCFWRVMLLMYNSSSFNILLYWRSINFGLFTINSLGACLNIPWIKVSWVQDRSMRVNELKRHVKYSGERYRESAIFVGVGPVKEWATPWYWILVMLACIQLCSTSNDKILNRQALFFEMLWISNRKK